MKNPTKVEFSPLEELNEDDSKKLTNLRNFIKEIQAAHIAYSGGVDSTLIAAISYEQLGERAVAVTGISPALAPHLLDEARLQASWIGIKHEEYETNELKNSAYTKNPENRCYACKSELHATLRKIASISHKGAILDGVNHDDEKDFRPGIQAAREAGVISPLAELKISKSTVRSISKSLGFPWWDKPAQPCLASRFPYGEPISSKRLKQTALAEKWIIDKGFSQVRVRIHGLSARIEILNEEIDQFHSRIERKEIVKYFLSIGFTSVSLDLEGLLSGKLNRDRFIN